jgi:hypothetical protein
MLAIDDGKVKIGKQQIEYLENKAYSFKLRMDP